MYVAEFYKTLFKKNDYSFMKKRTKAINYARTFIRLWLKCANTYDDFGGNVNRPNRSF